jgi:RNA polymerase sigma-70 factor (ECF subfamily)
VRERERIETAYRAGYPRFLRLATAVTGSEEAGHDAVQEGFARALRARERFRGEAALETWLWRIVLNAAKDARPRGVEELTEDDVPTANGHVTADSDIRAAVASLPERQRLILFLRHYADLDYERIAEVAGVRRGTVAATLNAAHAALRRQLEEVLR